MCKYQEYTLSLFLSLLFTFNSLNPKIKIWILICFPYSLPGIILWLLIWLVNQINNQSIIPSTDVIQLSLTLKMTTAKVVETSVTVNNNSPIQDFVHPDDQTQPTFEMPPGFKPFTVLWSLQLTQSSGLQPHNKAAMLVEKTIPFFPEFVLKQKTSHPQHM